MSSSSCWFVSENNGKRLTTSPRDGGHWRPTPSFLQVQWTWPVTSDHFCNSLPLPLFLSCIALSSISKVTLFTEVWIASQLFVTNSSHTYITNMENWGSLQTEHAFKLHSCEVLECSCTFWDILLENLTVTCLRNWPFMKPEGSSPYSQQLTTETHLKYKDPSHAQYFYLVFILVLTSHLLPDLPVSFEVLLLTFLSYFLSCSFVSRVWPSRFFGYANNI